MQFRKSKTFCAIPFVGLMIDNNQTMGFCCMAPGKQGRIKLDNGEESLAGVHKIHTAWNSKFMIDLRRRMVSGEETPACNNCFYREGMGKISNRQHSINEWAWRLGADRFNKLVQDCIDNNFISEIPPIYLDLRLGNLCNLKCRMCNPWNSSQIAKEHFDLYENDEYKKVWNKYLGKNPIYLKQENLWFESNFMWDEIVDMIPKLTKVYMTGGEPTLVEGNFKFMEACVKMGYADKITLFFNINCTNLNKRFLDLIGRFKNVSINASIDGVSDTNDYIRFPSKWSQIDENFNKLASINHIELNVSPVLTVFNVLECDKIIHYVKKVSEYHNKKIGIDYLFNSSVDMFDSTLVPLEFRLPVADRVQELLSDQWINTSHITRGSITGLIGILKSDQNKDSNSLINDFLELTKLQDQYRDQSLQKTFPVLYNILNVE